MENVILSYSHVPRPERSIRNWLNRERHEEFQAAKLNYLLREKRDQDVSYRITLLHS